MYFLLASCATYAASNKDSIVIAAVGPLTGPDSARGKDLTQAAQMAVEEINAAGGVGGKHFELQTYDDVNQASRASQLAEQIAKSPALAVLAQVSSSAAVAAGAVYKERKIPAITGAASESRVTDHNEWFFRLFRDAKGQGSFLADYARFQLGAKEIAVIRETGTAGDEFGAAFRDRAKSQKIRIVADLSFTKDQANDPATYAAFLKKLGKLRKGEIVVLGAQYSEAPGLLRVLRDKLGPFTAVGYSSLAVADLDGKIRELAGANQTPGYYTSGLVVAAPQMGDVAEFSQNVFANRFRNKYNSDPTPEAVRWYEGTRLIFQAIAAKHLKGTDKDADRREIREWLASLNSPTTAGEGVSGPIYFGADHSAQREISIGSYYLGQLVSDPVQFTPVSDPARVPGFENLLNNGLVVDTGTTKYVKTPVVYAGIVLNGIDNIDIRNDSFSADFFLWMRFSNDLNLDPHQVEFPTVVSGATLGKEVGRRIRDGFTTLTYHVKGVFHSEYEFSRFPFDQQTLSIPIQFHNSSNYSLILAYGHGPEDKTTASRANAKSVKSVLASKLWLLKDKLFYRDVVPFKSSFGEDEEIANGQAGVELNRINMAVTIKRDVLGFAIKNFLPLLCILIALLIGYIIAPDVINPRVSIGVTALLTCSVLYQKLAGDMPTVTYITAMDYVFFSFFLFCVAFLLLSVITYETHREKKGRLTTALNRGGLGLTVGGLAMTLGFVWLRFWGQA